MLLKVKNRFLLKNKANNKKKNNFLKKAKIFSLFNVSNQVKNGCRPQFITKRHNFLLNLIKKKYKKKKLKKFKRKLSILYKKFINLLFSYNLTNPEIVFFLKNLVKFVLVKAKKKKLQTAKLNLFRLINFKISKNNQFKKKILKSKKNNTTASLGFKKSIDFCRKFLYIINKKKILNKKNELKLQKFVFFFILKHRKYIRTFKVGHLFFTKLILLSIKKNKKIIKFNTKKLYIYKKAATLLISRNNKKKGKALYVKFIGLLTKKGKKRRALNLIKNSLSIIKQKSSTFTLFKKIYKILKISVELRRIKIRNSQHFVPFPIKFKRQINILTKLILSLTKSNKEHRRLENKLAEELYQILNKKKNSIAFQKIIDIKKNIKEFRSNVHYRW